MKEKGDKGLFKNDNNNKKYIYFEYAHIKLAIAIRYGKMKFSTNDIKHGVILKCEDEV